MITPIFNEPSCSNASCHAHQASTKVLGVLDVALRLDPIRKEERAMTLQAVLMTVAEVLIGAAFVILFTRRFFATPVRQLIEGTKSVSAMELDRPIKTTHSSQELDELVDSFNQMRERLKAAVSELNEMQQTLESKVEERTRQLQTAEHKLLQADRLASHGQLAASVAHEINNPVAGVLNLSMLLERLMANGQFPVGREAEFRKYLGIISTETARVGRIVSDLLTFSRRSKPQRVLADLNKLVRTTLGLTDQTLLINTETVLDLQENLPAVECDPSQIQQVILNLVLNGAQAMQSRGGGKLTIRTRALPDAEKMWSFLWRTRAKGSPRKTCQRFLIRSSPPNLKERESAWDWPSSTELSKRTTGKSKSQVVAMRAPSLRYFCRSSPKAMLRTPPKCRCRRCERTLYSVYRERARKELWNGSRRPRPSGFRCRSAVWGSWRYPRPLMTGSAGSINQSR